MLVTNKQLLEKAKKGRYAVGAFNINNLEFLLAVIAGAKKLKAPVIIQTTEGAIQYAGVKYLSSMVKEAARENVKISLHLDHGKNLDTIKDVIKSGYTSVMIDASHFNFEKNIKITKKVVKLAKPKGISVEAELGKLKGKEDLVNSLNSIYTDPDEAKDFVEKTGIDSLAISIGTSHGAYKFKGKPKLDLKRLEKINKKVKIPLVLHGASGVPINVLNQANKFGAKIQNAHGVTDEIIRKAIKLGICKINIDTDLRMAFNAAVRKTLYTYPKVFDPRKILMSSRIKIQEVVENHIRVFGSKGKA